MPDGKWRPFGPGKCLPRLAMLQRVILGSRVDGPIPFKSEASAGVRHKRIYCKFKTAMPLLGGARPEPVARGGGTATISPCAGHATIWTSSRFRLPLDKSTFRSRLALCRSSLAVANDPKSCCSRYSSRSLRRWRFAYSFTENTLCLPERNDHGQDVASCNSSSTSMYSYRLNNKKVKCVRGGRYGTAYTSVSVTVFPR
jgi:hypothetical protein